MKEIREKTIKNLIKNKMKQNSFSKENSDLKRSILNKSAYNGQLIDSFLLKNLLK